MDTFRFLIFPVYQEAKRLYCIITKATDKNKNFPIKNQIERASLSVILNIAEGSAKKSDKEFARYL